MSNFLRRTQKNVGTTPVDVGGYVVPTGKAATVVGFIITNVTGSTVTANAAIANSSSVSTYFLANADVAAKTVIIPIGGEQKVILQAGDSIRVASNTPNAFDVIMSFVES